MVTPQSDFSDRPSPFSFFLCPQVNLFSIESQEVTAEAGIDLTVALTTSVFRRWLARSCRYRAANTVQVERRSSSPALAPPLFRRAVTGAVATLHSGFARRCALPSPLAHQRCN